MNDRLLNNPIPPREIDPSISPELQEIIYRAMERDPKNRYASAREMALDLQHPDKVGVAERPELRDWHKRRTPWLRKILFYIIPGSDSRRYFRPDVALREALRRPGRHNVRSAADSQAATRCPPDPRQGIPAGSPVATCFTCAGRFVELHTIMDSIKIS